MEHEASEPVVSTYRTLAPWAPPRREVGFRVSPGFALVSVTLGGAAAACTWGALALTAGAPVVLSTATGLVTATTTGGMLAARPTRGRVQVVVALASGLFLALALVVAAALVVTTAGAATVVGVMGSVAAAHLAVCLGLCRCEDGPGAGERSQTQS